MSYKIQIWLSSRGLIDLFLGIYYTNQIIIFIFTYLSIYYDTNYSNIVNITYNGLIIAKTSSTLLNYNFMLLFVFINKSLIFKCSILFEDYINMIEYISIHINIVMTIAFFTIMHISAHIYNFIKLGQFQDNSTLSVQQSIILLFFKTYAGLSGIILTILLVIIYICALLKRYNYNLFYYTHLLYIFVIIGLLIHGSFCFIKLNNGNCTAQNFYKWILLPIILLVLEKLIIIYTSNKKTIFLDIIKHSNNINEIQLYKHDFTFKEGQWIYINCPSISKTEWHPFTITSNPIEVGKVTIHLKELGDWTFKLTSFLLELSQSQQVVINSSKNVINITYPYGTEQHITKYNRIILIAGGIGITTFISLIKKLPCNLGHGKKLFRNIRHIHLYWICKNIDDFLAFLPELQLINAVLLREHIENPLHVNLHITNISDSNINPYYPPFTFNKGRPNWDIIFKNLSLNPIKTKVLLCGSKQMSDSLYLKCKEWNLKNKKLLFYYNKGEVLN